MHFKYITIFTQQITIASESWCICVYVEIQQSTVCSSNISHYCYPTTVYCQDSELFGEKKKACLRRRRRKRATLWNIVAKISQCILLFLLTYSIIKFFQSRNSEEVLHVHSILNKEFHKVHPIQNQCIQHSLLQGVHLHCRMENVRLCEHRRAGWLTTTNIFIRIFPSSQICWLICKWKHHLTHMQVDADGRVFQQSLGQEESSEINL